MPAASDPDRLSATDTPADASSTGLRASDADRQQVADLLGTAYAEGRLSGEEHAERLDQALSARTFDELIPITRDLVYADAPAGPSTTGADARVDTRGASPEADRLVAVFGGAVRSGRWRVRRNTQAYALFGGVDLDLRDAVFEAPVVEISGFWCFGGMDIKVGEGVEVRDQTVGIFGGSDISHATAAQSGGPVLVIKGLALFGGVTVKTVRPKPVRTGSGWSRGDRRAERLEQRAQRLADRVRRRGQ